MDCCLTEAKTILDNLAIPFNVCSGTALGFRREGGFIEHDYDIDIAIEERYASPQIIDSFLANGFHVKFLPTLNQKHVEFSFIHTKTRIAIDIFVTFSHVINNKEVGVYNVLWDFHGKYSRGMGNPIVMYYKPYQIDTVNYNGDEYLCPDSEYLTQTYGKTWKTPIDYKTIGDDPYLDSLNEKYRPNLLTIEQSRHILEEKFGFPLVSGR